MSGEQPEGFQELMQEAMKMKTAQLEEKRKVWNKAPEFLKLTLTSKTETAKVRSLSTFAERLDFIAAHKEKGNALCQDRQYEQAIAEYTQALGVLLWFYLPDGKHSEEIPLHCGYKEDFSTDEETVQAQDCCSVLLLNIAHCLNKVSNWQASIYACTYVLSSLDKYSLKALYRRAVAYYSQGTSYTLDQAVEDLLTANSIDPEDKQVKQLLTKYFKEKHEQDRKDSKIWKRSFARIKKQSAEYDIDDDEGEQKNNGKDRRSLVGSLLNWAVRNPLVFLVYLLIFGHAMYKISVILANPI